MVVLTRRHRAHREPRKLIDKLSLAVAAMALIISLITLSLQFMAHDIVSLSRLDRRNTIWTNSGSYITVTLGVLNMGNRPAAVLAEAFLLEKTSIGDHVTDGDCNGPSKRTISLIRLSDNTKNDPALGSLAPFGSALEPGKFLIQNLLYSVFDKTSSHNMPLQGIICLDIDFFDSKGKDHEHDKVIEGVKIEQNNMIIPVSPRKQFSSEIIFNHRHVDLP